jgi:glutaredoxin
MSKKYKNKSKGHASTHKEHKHESEVVKEKSVPLTQNITLVAVACLIVGLIVGALIILGAFGNQATTLAENSTPAGNVDLDELKAQVSSFVSANLLPDTVAFEITDVTAGEDGIYEMKYNINQDGAVVESGVIYSSSARIILGNVMDMSEEIPQPEPTAPVEVAKSDVPDVELYVMSFCPFGNKAEDTMFPVYDLLKDKANFSVNYIISTGTSEELCAGYLATGVFATQEDCQAQYVDTKCKEYGSEWICSLHGDIETQQNIREVCVMENNGLDAWAAFTGYVNTNCGSDGSCWEAAAQSVGLDKDAINQCVLDDGLKLMQQNSLAANLAGASGSPTMIVNGTPIEAVYQYGNPEAYKQAICSAFNVVPEECSIALAGNTTTATGGSC